MNSTTSILPPRPLRLASGSSAKTMAWSLAAFVAAAACMVAAVFYSGGVFTLLNDSCSYDEWTEATHTHADFAVDSKRFRKHWAFTVVYKTKDGDSYEGEARMNTSLIGLSTDVSPVVHYDPSSPDRFVLNWTVAETTGRWIAELIVSGGALAIALVFAWLGWSLGSDVRLRRTVARRGVEVVATIVSKKEANESADSQANWVEYRYTLPGSDRVHKVNLDTFRDMPLALDWDETHIVTLVHPTRPKRAMLVMSHFGPFELSGAEEDDALKRLRIYRDMHYPSS